MIYRLAATQVLHTSLAEAWAFFSNPRNLAALTPPTLCFEVLSAADGAIYPGMMLEYRVRPLFGIPLRWLTEITQVEPERRFIDEQRIGPYRIWHHEHRFTPLSNGAVEMADAVTYVLPFGPFGAMAHPWLVKPQLDAIFAFRREKTASLFAQRSGAAS